MTKTREFNAASVEEAVGKAAEILGLAPEELSYEVLDQGSPGFLGLGARDARIRVDAAPEPDPTPPDAEPPETIEDERPTDPATDPDIEEEVSVPQANGGAAQPVDDDLLRETEEFVASAMEAMDLDARVEVYDAGDFVAVDVAVEETGLFIGQKGETIDALQYLANVAVYRDKPFVKRIVVDSEGYRQRRVEAIEGMAHRSARRAIRERRPVELPPMNPAERRIVHLYLRDNEDVTTVSEGNGDNRRVKISPAR